MVGNIIRITSVRDSSNKCLKAKLILREIGADDSPESYDHGEKRSRLSKRKRKDTEDMEGRKKSRKATEGPEGKERHGRAEEDEADEVNKFFESNKKEISNKGSSAAIAVMCDKIPPPRLMPVEKPVPKPQYLASRPQTLASDFVIKPASKVDADSAQAHANQQTRTPKDRRSRTNEEDEVDEINKFIKSNNKEISNERSSAEIAGMCDERPPPYQMPVKKPVPKPQYHVSRPQALASDFVERPASKVDADSARAHAKQQKRMPKDRSRINEEDEVDEINKFFQSNKQEISNERSSAEIGVIHCDERPPPRRRLVEKPVHKPQFHASRPQALASDLVISPTSKVDADSARAHAKPQKRMPKDRRRKINEQHEVDKINKFFKSNEQEMSHERSSAEIAVIQCEERPPPHLRPVQKPVPKPQYHASRPQALSSDLVIGPTSKVDADSARPHAKPQNCAPMDRRSRINKNLQRLIKSNKKTLQAVRLSAQGRALTTFS